MPGCSRGVREAGYGQLFSARSRVFNFLRRSREAQTHTQSGSRARRFLREFEPDFAIFQFQIRREWAASFRDEAVEKIGLSRGKKFLRLLFWNVEAKNRFAQSKFAWRSGRLLTFTE